MANRIHERWSQELRWLRYFRYPRRAANSRSSQSETRREVVRSMSAAAVQAVKTIIGLSPFVGTPMREAEQFVFCRATAGLSPGCAPMRLSL